MPSEQISRRSIVLFYAVLAILLAAGFLASVRNSYRLRSNMYQREYQELMKPFPEAATEKKIAEELKINPTDATASQKKQLLGKLEKERKIYLKRNTEKLQELKQKKFLFLWNYPDPR